MVQLSGPFVASPGAVSMTARSYVEREAAAENDLVDLFLAVLLGISVGYTALAVANTVLMATYARRQELVTLHRTGATPGQTVRVVVVESLLAVVLGVALGLAVAVPALFEARAGLQDEIGAPVTLVMPWATLAFVAGGCALLAAFASYRAVSAARALVGGCTYHGGVTGSKRVLLAKPRGYCAGVDRAVQTVEEALEHYGAPVYVRKEIVHNKHVVGTPGGEGAIFVEENDEVPEGATVVFSAHGVAPEVHEQAARPRLRAIDATCPLVTKVHQEARRFAAEDYDILLIGHEGHEEVMGTAGEAPDHIQLVDGPDGVDKVDVRDPSKVVWLSQTTLSVDETLETVAPAAESGCPLLMSPPSDDICYATSEPPGRRQGDGAQLRRRPGGRLAELLQLPAPARGRRRRGRPRRLPHRLRRRDRGGVARRAPPPSASPPAPRSPRSWSWRSSTSWPSAASPTSPRSPRPRRSSCSPCPRSSSAT